MNRLTDREIDEIARRIAADIRGGGQAPLPVPVADGQAGVIGVFPTVSEAVSAAAAAQK